MKNKILEPARPAASSLGLIVLAWVVSLAALPVCGYAFLDAAFSPASPRPWSHPIAEPILLLAGPVIALACMLRVFLKCKITVGKVFVVLIPCFLSVAELILTINLWTHM